MAGMTPLPFCDLSPEGANHFSGEVLGHPGRLLCYLMLLPGGEASIGLWRPAEEPYTHRCLVGSGKLVVVGDEFVGTVKEGAAVWHVRGSLKRLAFSEHAPEVAA